VFGFGLGGRVWDPMMLDLVWCTFLLDDIALVCGVLFVCLWFQVIVVVGFDHKVGRGSLFVWISQGHCSNEISNQQEDCTKQATTNKRELSRPPPQIVHFPNGYQPSQ
jgi:hypothetical protein